MTAATLKTALCRVIATQPTLERQQLFAGVVRRVWRGFAAA